MEFCIRLVIFVFAVSFTLFAVCAAIAPFPCIFDAIADEDWRRTRVWAQYICVEAVLFGVIWWLL